MLAVCVGVAPSRRKLFESKFNWTLTPINPLIFIALTVGHNGSNLHGLPANLNHETVRPELVDGHLHPDGASTLRQAQDRPSSARTGVFHVNINALLVVVNVGISLQLM